MSLLLRLDKNETYASVVWHDSVRHPGVRFAIRRASLLQRIELTRALKALTAKEEFLRAGDALEEADAALADLLAKKLYLEWAVADLAGLSIDGHPADVNSLVARGPEDLCDEIVETIRASLELTEQETKNS